MYYSFVPVNVIPEMGVDDKLWLRSHNPIQIGQENWAVNTTPTVAPTV